MLGISMRVMRHAYPGGAEEERDALARDWPRFLQRVFPEERVLYLPNMGAETIGFAGGLKLSGLILSGGENWGVSPARDATERALFAWAWKTGIPIFGVCRGAQVINLLAGGTLETCDRHTATRHGLELTRPLADSRHHEVNSFHAQAIRPHGLAPGLEPFALAPDGTVEGFMNADGRIIGVMWHPEREAQPAPLDLALLRAWPAKR